MVRVSRIHPGSIAEEIGLQPGTELLTINGRDLND
jgi:S1-C subfamily serine protease